MPSPQIDPELAVKALSLRDAGYSQAQIAQITGINRSTVWDVIHGHGNWGKIAELPVFKRWREEQNQRLEAASRAASATFLCRALDESKLEKAGSLQLAVAAKLTLESARLLAGESTQNVEVHVKVQDMDALARSLSEALLSSPESKAVTAKSGKET